MIQKEPKGSFFDIVIKVSYDLLFYLKNVFMWFTKVW